MSRPTILACADLGDHVVDLWIEDGRGWFCSNDDRSVIGAGLTPDDALDDYLLAIEDARDTAA